MIFVRRNYNIEEMYCWGSMKNGELGLGGLEEETVTEPRAHQFSLAGNVVEGNTSQF